MRIQCEIKVRGSGHGMGGEKYLIQRDAGNRLLLKNKIKLSKP